ncbi:hypothetical protein [Nodosilinea sp. E11]|uniref:hypothetical protein n=1 Tax=Nodosilinea sp. E11 TaxID=3037479 RepID=UPI0029343B36|nr:hypothetical protein [Nodosilinea sp. E11]WOD37908.1 hypothetical protein RRF56_16980 [Nodosilinea sp. E11]
MSSPFSTFEEFEGAIDGPTGGAIYTFANNPAINTIALLICVGLFIWFLVRTFATHHEMPAVDQSLSHLSAFIVAGLLSIAGAEYRQTMQPNQPAETQPQAMSHRPGAKATLGLLGLAGVGLPVGRRGAKTASSGRSRRKGRYRDLQSPRS